MAATKLDAHTVRRISVASGRDPRTVVAALQGRASPLATAAVLDAVARLGIALDGDAPGALDASLPETRVAG